MKKVCIVTGTRAEYGLLQNLMMEVKEDPLLELQLVVTGMHLSPEFGLTYKSILEDGFKIDKKIEILMSSDSPVGVAKSTGLGVISFSEAFDELKPDIVVLLGDRFEALAAAIAATIVRLPIAHIHGGEATEGLIDEPIRHSITKMSHLHFAACEIYRNRIIQLGEQPNRVFNFGAMGIDNIINMKLLNKSELEKQISFKLGKKSLLVVFHPITLEAGTSGKYFQTLLDVLNEFEDVNLIFTKPNADTDGRIISQLIDEYVKENDHRAVAFTSMGQLRFLSAMKHVDGIVGNSSSGLLEMPSFKKGTVDIGDRQKGRVKAKSVLSTDYSYDFIKKSIEELFSNNFRDSLADMESPFGLGGASKKVKEVIKNEILDNILMKKFFDIEMDI